MGRFSSFSDRGGVIWLREILNTPSRPGEGGAAPLERWPTVPGPRRDVLGLPSTLHGRCQATSLDIVTSPEFRVAGT